MSSAACLCGCISVCARVTPVRQRANIEPFIHQRTNLDPILPRRSDDFPSVELQRRDSVVILECFKDAARPNVPNLHIKRSYKENPMGFYEIPTHPHCFVQATTDNVDFVKLQTCYRTSVSRQCTDRLSSSHWK